MRQAVLRASCLAVMFTALVPAPAFAAMRECKRTVWSAKFTGNNEQAAMKRALDDWTAKVKVYGLKFTRWQLAVAHQIQCSATAKAKYECVACGAPCTIVQAPESWRRGSHRIIEPCSY